ncbi:hypothetical protein, partial [Streptomyces sp. NPDC053726]|uniref:hypothetical protein n=1 Tax=Streptomyces sp. NPDC053726 TaxID=3365713 RepID=UPI0037D65C20
MVVAYDRDVDLDLSLPDGEEPLAIRGSGHFLIPEGGILLTREDIPPSGIGDSYVNPNRPSKST